MSGFFSAIGSLIQVVLVLVFFAAIVLAFFAFSGYNQLRQLSEGIKECWSNVTVVQRKQVSLINQLIEVVTGFQESEKLVMLKVSADQTSANAVSQLHQESGTVLSTINGMAQKFPELKSSQQYLRLIDSIQGCENDLERARQLFNDRVKQYNVFRSSIPHVFYSRTLGFNAATYLEFSGVEQVADMGTLKSFSSDADGERLNLLLGSVGTKALQLGSNMMEGGKGIAAKAVVGGRLLTDAAKEKMDGVRANVKPLPPPKPPEALYYYLDTASQAQGPVSLAAIRAQVAVGELKADVLVVIVGGSDWVPLTNS